MNAPWLLADTAAPLALIAVARGCEVLASRELDESRHHAELLPRAFDEVIAAAALRPRDLGGVAVGRGPGSFVGVRVGLSYGKGVATALGIPLVGLCGMTAMADEPGLPDGQGLVVLDARKGELYVLEVERADGGVISRGEPRTLNPTETDVLAMGRAFVVGNALSLLAAGTWDGVSRAGPTPEGLAQLLSRVLAGGAFCDERESLVPVYCRAPDAKLPT